MMLTAREEEVSCLGIALKNIQLSKENPKQSNILLYTLRNVATQPETAGAC